MMEQAAYDGPERRETVRFATEIAIGLREAGRHRMPATLTSLSTAGASVSGVTLSDSAQLVWIRLPGLESLPARRCWSTPGAAGFAFDAPLHPTVAWHVVGHDPAPKPHGGPVSERLANRPASRRDQILGGLGEIPPGLLSSKMPREGAARLGGMIRRDASRTVEQRLEARYPPPGPAAVGFHVDGRPVSLRDISESGLQVDAEVTGEIGREVEIQFEGFPAIAGTVAWIDQGATGLRLPEGSLHLFEVD